MHVSNEFQTHGPSVRAGEGGHALDRVATVIGCPTDMPTLSNGE
jgi:hypothetical protein